MIPTTTLRATSQTDLEALQKGVQQYPDGYTIGPQLTNYLLGNTEEPIGMRTLWLDEETHTVRLIDTKKAGAFPVDLPKIRQVIVTPLLTHLCYLYSHQELDTLHGRLERIDKSIIDVYNKAQQNKGVWEQNPILGLMDTRDPANFEEWIARRRLLLPEEAN